MVAGVSWLSRERTGLVNERQCVVCSSVRERFCAVGGVVGVYREGINL
jgi:hypothetical protein